MFSVQQVEINTGRFFRNSVITYLKSFTYSLGGSFRDVVIV